METASRNAERRTKTVRYSDRKDVMSSCKKLSADGTCGILYSLCGCVWCVCYRSGNVQYVRRLSWSSEGGTRLAMPKTDLRVGYLVIEAGSGATKGVLD